jgi:hypothetical protein
MDNVSEEIEVEVTTIKDQVASGAMSAADGAEILNELMSAQKALCTAEAEVAIRYLAAAIEALSAV